MRIAFAIRDRKNFIGGPAANATRLLPALRDQGHDVHVLGFWVGKEEAHANLDELRAAGIPCRIIKKHTFTEDGVRWILEQIRDIQPDILMADLSTEGCFASRWLVPAGIPVVNSVFGNDDINLGRGVYFSDCPSPWRVSGHIVYGVSLLKKLRSMTKTHLPAIALSVLAEFPDATANYPAHGNLSILYSGRLVEYQKRTGDLVNAFISLAHKHPQFQFHLLGDSVDNERAEYEQRVKESNLQDRILFHGILFGEAYYNELLKHQVIILLSDSEGMPGALIDGMAAGLVPVCLRYPGIEDILVHGYNGCIVEDRGANLEAALVQLSANPSLWAQLSLNARETIHTQFSRSVIIARLEKFLQDLLENCKTKKQIEIPKKIRLPHKSSLLLEERRRPTFLQKIMRKTTCLSLLTLLCCLFIACRDTDTENRNQDDKAAALHHLKRQFIQRSFDTYHLERVPDAGQCLALLDSQGIFNDAKAAEEMYLQHRDSFYTVEMASFDYSRFLVHQLSRLWKIAEQYRRKKNLNPSDENLVKLLRGIRHYGTLELDRPGNRFQHKYSDMHTAAIAINMYFCLYPLMEQIRLERDHPSTVEREVYDILTAIGLQSWTVPPRHDSTDIQPIQLKRFSNYTWWITGNVLEFRPAYACALMMHSVEMVDIIAALVEYAMTTVSPATADTAFWPEGITSDGGGWAYGRQTRTWSYPFRGLRAALQRMAEFKGTPWEIRMTEEKVSMVMNFIRRSSFFYYKGFIPPCQDRHNFNVLEQIPEVIPSLRLAELLLKKFPEALTQAQKRELQLFIDHASIEAQTENVEFDSAYAGTRYYYCHDDLIRKTQNYYVYINMASRRVDGIESAVQYADVHNYFGADGATFFMRSGDEYHKALGAFELTAHPGVTARYGDAMLIPGRNLMGHCSRHNYAAGLVTDHGSCAGFIFEKMRGLDKYRHLALEDTLFENDQEWLYGVTAQKSYFWFDDQLVALGCGIANSKPDLGSEIHTTIDQSLYINSMYQGKSLKPGDSEVVLVKARNASGNDPIPVENNGFLYRILPDQTPGEVWLQVESRPTRWDELNILNRELNDKSQSADVFQLWINHGRHPADDRYGYSVYCGRGEAPPIPRVLINSTRLQAMSSEDGDHVQAIFFETDTLKCDGIFYHVSTPCAFSALRTGHTLTLTVSDARMDTSLDSIIVTTNLPIAHARRAMQFYQVAIKLPEGKYRGKQASELFNLKD